MKIHLVQAELFHSEGQTDRQTAERTGDTTKLIDAFRNFSKVPKKGLRYEINCLTSFPVLLPLHIKLSPKYNQINRLLCNLLHVISTKTATYHR